MFFFKLKECDICQIICEKVSLLIGYSEKNKQTKKQILCKLIQILTHFTAFAVVLFLYGHFKRNSSQRALYPNLKHGLFWFGSRKSLIITVCL